MDYSNVIVIKPWGSESLIYQNADVGIWHLSINAEHSTSLHAHPSKRTGLIVCAGIAQVFFLNGSHILTAGDKINIRNGVFHRTLAKEYNLELIEVETPNLKHDLIRLEDGYGRSGQPYEGKEHHINKENQINWQTDECVRVGHCYLNILHTTGKEDLISRSHGKVIVLEGRVYYKDYNVLVPGEVIDHLSLRKLAAKFEVTPMTIMVVSKMMTGLTNIETPEKWTL